MENNITLPDTGYLRIPQIIGQRAVTREEAQANKLKAIEAKKSGKKINVGPCTPRPAIPPIVPWSKSKLWDAVKKNEFPAPVKLSTRTTAWTVQSVREFCQRMAQA